MQAVIETTHLLLRPWQQEDVDPLVRLLAKPEVARYLHLDGRSFTREETVEVHRRVLRSWNEQGLGPWTVIDKTSGSWIGKLGLMYQEDWPGPDKFEVDYELDPAFWGRGLATEGTQAALRYEFVERSLPQDHRCHRCGERRLKESHAEVWTDLAGGAAVPQRPHCVVCSRCLHLADACARAELGGKWALTVALVALEFEFGSKLE